MLKFIERRREKKRLEKERKDEYLRQKKDEESYTATFGERKKKQEKELSELEAANKRVIQETERLSVTEQRLSETQRIYEDKIRSLEASVAPQNFMATAMQMAFSAVWDIHKATVLEMMQTVKNEALETERKKYEESLDRFKTQFEHVNGVMDASSIAKLVSNLKEEAIRCERKNDARRLETIYHDLNTLKSLGVIENA